MRVSGSIKTAAAMIATAALGVTAASAFVGSTPAVTRHSPDAAPGTDIVDQTARDPDPDRSLDWAVRTYTSTSGGDCVELGRRQGGRFGQVDADGAFEATPADAAGTCGSLLEEPVLLAINHYPASGQRVARTVLFGQARADVAELRVSAPDGSERRPVRGARGGFAIPLAGSLKPAQLPVQVTLRTGERMTFDWR